MTDYEPQTRKDLPHGHTVIGVDDNGIEHRYAGGVRDHRVFLLDGDTVAEVHDLDELADAGAVTDTTHNGEYYPATTPRAWVAAWADHVGWRDVRLATDIIEAATQARGD
jgi:hypothetical protein